MTQLCGFGPIAFCGQAMGLYVLALPLIVNQDIWISPLGLLFGGWFAVCRRHMKKYIAQEREWASYAPPKGHRSW